MDDASRLADGMLDCPDCLLHRTMPEPVTAEETTAEWAWINKMPSVECVNCPQVCLGPYTFPLRCGRLVTACLLVLAADFLSL
ncbi:hypothetical protein ACOMHN_010493 [Nucella lapillus]